VSDVHVTFRKWPARPHWEFDAVRLGNDEHGVWLGAPAGVLRSVEAAPAPYDGIISQRSMKQLERARTTR
jgi:hypothetical protein